jgi:two-component system cell cycle sensor histidine kinase/response regulator CckA
MKDEQTTNDQFLKGGSQAQPRPDEERFSPFPFERGEEGPQIEERYRRLVDLSPDLILLHSQGNYIYVNPAGIKTLGASGPEELIGKAVSETIHPDYREIEKGRIKQLMEGKPIPFIEEKYLRLDGTAVELEVAAAPLVFQGRPTVLVVGRDITERKLAQEALRKTEEKYRSIFETTGAGTMIIEENLIVSLVNSEFERLSGYPKEEVEGKKRWIDFFLEDDLKKLKEYHRLRTISPDWAPRSCEGQFLTKSGKALEVLFTVGMIPGTKKSVGSFLDITHLKRAEEAIRRLAHENDIMADISRIISSTLNIEEVYERFAQEVRKLIQRAEEALRASEEKYRLLVENAIEAIFVVQDETIKFPNRRTLSLLGYSAEELSQIPFSRLIHSDDQEAGMDRYRRRVQGEEMASNQSYRCLNKAGEEVWVQINSVPISWEGGPATLNFLRDVTREKKLEAQFRNAQKMEAIGTLAGGIAHDFNNILMGIQGYVSLVLCDLDPGHPHHENLKKIEEQVKNAANLAGQLLAFARKGKYEVKPSDLNKIIERSSSMFERTKKEIKIYRRYEKSIWVVEVDQTQIEQVLLNLFVNAWQAMPEGGNLFLETKNVSLGPDYIRPFALQAGDYVRISVADTGIGMDKETRQRIFEPFFTTKEMGRGTGLGLAAVYGIIKNHGGFINVYSEIGHGTTFNIYLPASERAMPTETMVSGEIQGGTETIFLVDDESTILEVMEKALTLSGYKVILAQGGEEAVEVYKKEKDRIDLVLLDMIMPGMSGGKVFDLLREMNPGVKVILSSGYSMGGEASKILARGCKGFMQKPFGIKELSQKIREVLDEPEDLIPNPTAETNPLSGG